MVEPRGRLLRVGGTVLRLADDIVLRSARFLGMYSFSSRPFKGDPEGMAPVRMGAELSDDYLFFARTVQASCIRQLLDVLEKLLKDVSLVVTPEGLKIATMDGSQICLIHVMLKAREFQTFHCTKQMFLGCKLPEVAKLLKSATHNDTVTLYVAKGSVNELGVCVDNKDTDFSVESRYTLLDIDYEECGFQDVDFAYVITLPSAQLQRICRRKLLQVCKVVVQLCGQVGCIKAVACFQGVGA